LRHVPKFVALLAAAAVSVTGTAGLASAAPIVPTLATPAWGTYQTVTPARVLDTRDGTGVPAAAVGPVLADGTLDLNVLGVSGVPATGVSAVVLNLTVTTATKPSFLTVWPSGTTKPNVSSINFVAGTNRANLVTVPVGANGKISIWNPAGTVQVIADVMGYYNSDAATTAGGFYQYAASERKLDTRKSGGPLAPGQKVSVPVDLSDPFIVDANAHISALAVNITAVNPTARGFLTAWDGVGAAPGTSNLNFSAGTVTPNMAIVPVGKCVACGTSTGLPSISVVNGSTGTVNVLVDIVGYYDDGQLVDTVDGLPVDGARFKPMTPTRIVDSRSGLGTTTFKGSAVNKMVQLPARAGAGPDSVAVVTNTTAVVPSLPTFVTLWADFGFGDPMPTVSNLNAVKGDIVANGTITELAFDLNSTSPIPLFDRFSIYNNAGIVNVLVDVVGTMEYPLSGLGLPVAGLSASSAPKSWKR
jgi:hypothetical protein